MSPQLAVVALCLGLALFAPLGVRFWLVIADWQEARRG